MIFRALLVLVFACFFSPMSFAASSVTADQLRESRYCGSPLRDASGDIYRSSTVRAVFMRNHPCPVTGKPSGSCPGWEVDHVIPLACGGCDAVSNMQWLPIDLKHRKAGKDGFERRIYGQGIEGTSCGIPPIVR